MWTYEQSIESLTRKFLSSIVNDPNASQREQIRAAEVLGKINAETAVHQQVPLNKWLELLELVDDLDNVPSEIQKLDNLMNSTMTPEELQQKAIAALTQAEKLQTQLLRLTVGKVDRAAVQNAIASTRAAVEVLTEWYGKQPE